MCADCLGDCAFVPMAGQTMYAATKAALNGLTLALRYELWDENIHVTSATPGVVDTPIRKTGGNAGNDVHDVLTAVLTHDR